MLVWRALRSTTINVSEVEGLWYSEIVNEKEHVPSTGLTLEVVSQKRGLYGKPDPGPPADIFPLDSPPPENPPTATIAMATMAMVRPQKKNK
jgi:hypothetical protein